MFWKQDSFEYCLSHVVLISAHKPTTVIGLNTSTIST